MNKQVMDQIRMLIGIFLIFFGILFFIVWWTSLGGLATPSEDACEWAKYPLLPPFHMFMLATVAIIAGSCLLLLNIIKKMNAVSKIIFTFFIVIFLLFIGLKISADYYPEPNSFGPYVRLEFETDKTNGTLTVTSLITKCGDSSDYIWDNVEINGSATKPTGLINIGDTITSCSGEVSIFWRPRPMDIYIYNFDN